MRPRAARTSAAEKNPNSSSSARAHARSTRGEIWEPLLVASRWCLDDALLCAFDCPSDGKVDVLRGHVRSSTPERDLRGQLGQELCVVRETLGERGDLLDGPRSNLHPGGRDAGRRDSASSAGVIRGMWIWTSALDRSVLTNELADAVCDPDEKHGGADETIRAS